MRYHSEWLLCAAIAAIACAPPEPPKFPLVARPIDSAGVVRGIVRDSSGTQRVKASVIIPGTSKYAIADDSGRFRLAGVQNPVVIETRAIAWDRRIDTLRLEVNRGLEVELILRMVPVVVENAACCTSAPQARTSGDSLAMMIAAYTTAFTNGTGTAHGAAKPEVVCVQGLAARSDPPAEVVAALQKDRTMLVRPMSGCRIEPLSGATRSVSLVVDTLTGKRGISIGVSSLVVSDDGSFTFRTGYYQHGLSAASYKCEGRRDRGAWVVTACKLEWIS